MNESHLSARLIEEEIHRGLKEEDRRLGYSEDLEPFYTIRHISPATRTAIIGRDGFENEDIAGLLKFCGRLTTMVDPNLLYDQIADRVEKKEVVGIDTIGQLPNIWREVFYSEVDRNREFGTWLSNGQFSRRSGNLRTLSEHMEEFVKQGIGSAFERVRLEIEIAGETVEVIQRCPIHSFVRKRWLPAYIEVRNRLTEDKAYLIPVEKEN